MGRPGNGNQAGSAAVFRQLLRHPSWFFWTHTLQVPRVAWAGACVDVSAAGLEAPPRGPAAWEQGRNPPAPSAPASVESCCSLVRGVRGPVSPSLQEKSAPCTAAVHPDPPGVLDTVPTESPGHATCTPPPATGMEAQHPPNSLTCVPPRTGAPWEVTRPPWRL